MTMHKRFCNTNSGFSLVEMMVSIAIIAVLVAVALTALRGARQTARSAVCQNNLRTFGAALTSYRGANNDNLPFAQDIVDIRSQQFKPLDALSAHLAVPLPVVGPGGEMVGGQPFACPADQRDFGNYGFSYFYQPMTAMASIASEYGAGETPRIYSRQLADLPEEEFFTDFRPNHQGKRNVLMSSSAVTSK